MMIPIPLCLRLCGYAVEFSIAYGIDLREPIVVMNYVDPQHSVYREHLTLGVLLQRLRTNALSTSHLRTTRFPILNLNALLHSRKSYFQMLIFAENLDSEKAQEWITEVQQLARELEVDLMCSDFPGEWDDRVASAFEAYNKRSEVEGGLLGHG